MTSLAALIRHDCRYAAATEASLQWAVEETLRDAAIGYERERRLSPTARIDFYLPETRTGIELKIDGSPNVVLRQLHRYAGFAEIERLILVTTHARLGGLPDVLQGKPLETVVLWSAGL